MVTSHSTHLLLSLILMLVVGCFPKPDEVRFVHLTDPHFFDTHGKQPLSPADQGCLNFEMFKSTLDKINAEHAVKPFDFAVVTGDIGVEKLIERAIGQSCNEVTLRKSDSNAVLFNNINKDKEIFASLKVGANLFANTLMRSHISKWLFVSGNNDLCNENTLTVSYFNQFMSLLKEALEPTPVRIQNLIADADYVDTFSPRSNSKHVFIGFENGSWKNNHSKEYALVVNRTFQRNVLDSLKKEVSLQLSQGKYAHLIFHIPHFDDPYYVTTSFAECANRKPTNVVYNTDCTQSTPVIPANSVSHPYSAWLVENAFRQDWNSLIANQGVKSLFAGHFHVAKRSYYQNLLAWQNQPYAHIAKYDVASPIAVKNQIINDTVDQGRGFSVVDIDSNGNSIAKQLFADQRQNYRCPGNVQITQWESND